MHAWSSLPTWAKAALVAGGAYAAREVFEKLSEKDVEGEVVLITGAGSGIGRLTAKKLGAMKARMVLWDVNKTAVEVVGAWLATACVPPV